MKKVNEVEELKNKIALLKLQQETDLTVLKDQFNTTCESLKPMNLIKSTFKDVASSPDLKTTIIKNAIGFATGYLSKKVLIGSTHNPIKRILGNVVEFVVANVVTKRINTVK